MLTLNPNGVATIDLLTKFQSRMVHGVSTKNLGSMSLGIQGADRDQVLTNRKNYLNALQLDEHLLTLGEQLHTNNVHIVTEKDIGSGWNTEDTLIPNTDALVTNLKNVPIGIRTADCVPVFLYDTKMNVIGLAHAGWKGTVKKIAVNTVQTMIEQFNSNSADILVGLGPSIGPCCYEVREDVINQVTEAFPSYPELIQTRDGKHYLDLWAANKIQLQELGIPVENIESPQYCTKDNAKEFFSFRDRMAGGEAGLFIALMCLKQ